MNQEMLDNLLRQYIKPLLEIQYQVMEKMLTQKMLLLLNT